MLQEFLIKTQNSLGIPRSQMPQIKKEDIPEFIQELKQNGISIQFLDFPASRLKPTQAEINKDKVDSKSDILSKPIKPFIVSRDFRILDGHHQLYAILDKNPQQKVSCWYIGVNMLELLHFARKFSRVTYKEINEAMNPFLQFDVEVKKIQGFSYFHWKNGEYDAGSPVGVFMYGPFQYRLAPNIYSAVTIASEWRTKYKKPVYFCAPGIESYIKKHPENFKIEEEKKKNKGKKFMNFKDLRKKLNLEETQPQDNGQGIYNSGMKAIFAGKKAEKKKKLKEDEAEMEEFRAYGAGWISVHMKDGETNVDKLRDKQDREKEELQKKQEDETLAAKEQDLRDKLEQQRRERDAKRDEQERERDMKESRKSFQDFQK